MTSLFCLSLRVLPVLSGVGLDRIASTSTTLGGSSFASASGWFDFITRSAAGAERFELSFDCSA